MKVVNEYYAVYHTEESDGYDICIKDSCGRYALISKEDIESLVEDLVRFLQHEDSLVSVHKPFGEL
jgi:Cys-tRNA synthase (O-phospho-L-seryl-tRNA:Cys-tRNA synthase)